MCVMCSTFCNIRRFCRYELGVSCYCAHIQAFALLATSSTPLIPILDVRPGLEHAFSVADEACYLVTPPPNGSVSPYLSFELHDRLCFLLFIPYPNETSFLNPSSHATRQTGTRAAWVLPVYMLLQVRYCLVDFEPPFVLSAYSLLNCPPVLVLLSGNRATSISIAVNNL